jgi:hypothetical protein
VSEYITKTELKRIGFFIQIIVSVPFIIVPLITFFLGYQTGYLSWCSVALGLYCFITGFVCLWRSFELIQPPKEEV